MGGGVCIYMHVDSAKIKYYLYACSTSVHAILRTLVLIMISKKFLSVYEPYMFSKTYSDIIIIM